VRGLFVTGTDTGCGKTRVGCALARSARAGGVRLRVLKPVETGCEPSGGELAPADALALARAAGDARPLDAICPYRLALPPAPDAAARAAGIEIDPARIGKAFAGAADAGEAVLVEGAGGLLVPIRAGFDMADLARTLELPVLVVARAALGTLNHAQLTVEAARRRGLHVLGVIVSHTEPAVAEGDRRNLALLGELLPVPVLAELAHGAERLTPDLDVRELLRGA
jgi:dethiobiotin synthetase